MINEQSTSNLADSAPATRAQREVITYVMHNGVLLPLSKRIDHIWDFRPYLEMGSKDATTYVINWTTVPSTWVESLKDVIDAYWVHGIPGVAAPKPPSVLGFFSSLRRFAKFLYKYGVHSFSEVTGIHFSQYIQSIKRRKSNYQAQVLIAVEKVYLLRPYISDCYLEHPWPGQTACGIAQFYQGMQEQLETPYIPLEIATKLHQSAWAFLAKSENYFNALKISLDIDQKYNSASTSTRLRRRRAALRELGMTVADVENYFSLMPIACYVLIALHSGMRISEISSLSIGAYSETQHEGETIGWLHGFTFKSNPRSTEWMINLDVGRFVISKLEQYASLHHHNVDSRILELELTLRSSEAEQASKAAELHVMKLAKNKLFIQ